MTQAYPLQWPLARPRTANRKSAQFGAMKQTGGRNYANKEPLTVAHSLDRLQAEINRLGAEDAILSTNLPLNLNGSPKSNAAAPSDPGVALYFKIGDKPHCLPCDRYDRVADNIAAIAKHIEATRAIERYGVANLAEMFAGFMALPAPGAKRPWREVFGLERDASLPPGDIGVIYRGLAKEWAAAGRDLTDLNVARDEAMAEVGL